MRSPQTPPSSVPEGGPGSTGQASRTGRLPSGWTSECARAGRSTNGQIKVSACSGVENMFSSDVCLHVRTCVEYFMSHVCTTLPQWGCH
jgi:hypothetical protein